MTRGVTVRVLLFIGSNLFLLSYQACEEADAHDYYSCVPVNDAPPSVLGLEGWITVCIFLFVMASGFILSALLVFTRNCRMADHLIGLELHNHQKMEN